MTGSVCDAAVKPPLDTAAARSSTPSSSALEALICARETPATSTSCRPSDVGRSTRIVLLYTSPFPLISASAVTSTPSASTRTWVLWYRSPHSLPSDVLESSNRTLAGAYVFSRIVVTKPPQATSVVALPETSVDLVVTHPSSPADCDEHDGAT